MLATIRRMTDRLLGRGSAAITVPVMDGALKPNRAIDQAERVAELPGIDDLAVDRGTLWASAGDALHRLGPDGLTRVRAFDAPVTAVAFSHGGRLAVALGGRRIVVLGTDGANEASLDALGGRPLVAVNALAWQGEDQLLFTDGSTHHAPADWCRDLMTLGASGRVGRWQPAAARAEELAQGLAYAFGVQPTGDGAVAAESWSHRLVRVGRDGGVAPLLSELPGYPSRLVPAVDGGWWLTCFVCRTQLVEFVLREPAYRERMVAELAPEHWIAPALSTGHTFLEPLQGAGVKNMGVLKPWAPPRSYGLVIKVSADGRIERSLHSQVDGRHHGITAVAEIGDALYVASKGSGLLLKAGPHGGSTMGTTTGEER